jgi:hypothetical protein
MGRKKKYTKKSLAEAVERYFDSISRDVHVTEKRDSGRRDSKGHVIYEEIPVYNRLGDQVVITEFVEPPTVGGLCQFLGIHRSTWAEWCDPTTYPEFSDTTTRARGRMRAWCESQLLTRKDVKGIIFNLQNNYDYKERHEVDLSPGAAKAVATGNLSMAEKMALLQEIGADFGGMFPIGDDEEP